MAHGALGDTKLLCGACEAHVSGSGLEGPKCAELWEASRHRSLVHEKNSSRVEKPPIVHKRRHRGKTRVFLPLAFAYQRKGIVPAGGHEKFSVWPEKSCVAP